MHRRNAPLCRPPARVFASALALLVAPLGCGPGALEDNVERPGPIEGSFAVSRFFTASGYMGDGEKPGFLLGSVDEGCLPRPAGAEGSCYRFDYKVGPTKWAGVFWQFPANNWGSRPGRKVATRFSKVRFAAAGRFTVTLPAGAGVGAACGDGSACRPGLSCSNGACTLGHASPEGADCLVSGECAPGLQCAGQRCTASSGGVDGASCGAGLDERCADGLHCGVVGGALSCTAEGPGDVGATCAGVNDCLGGLYCEQGSCQPSTRMGPFNFQVGGITSTKPTLVYEDQIGVQYFPEGDAPQPVLTPELQYFAIDLSAEAPETLIGAFMWATAFPDIDEVSKVGLTAYRADPSSQATIYIDDLVFEEAP